MPASKNVTYDKHVAKENGIPPTTKARHSNLPLREYADDVWATIGSCNLHRYSLFGSGEMNATFWSPGVSF